MLLGTKHGAVEDHHDIIRFKEERWIVPPIDDTVRKEIEQSGKATARRGNAVRRGQCFNRLYNRKLSRHLVLCRDLKHLK